MSDVRDEAPTHGGFQESPPSPYNISQRMVAEFVGAFALLFISIGSTVAADVAGGGTAGAGLITIALAPGLAIASMASAVGHVSGAHFNPAVTVAAWITGKIETASAALYVFAQLAGGIAGAALIRAAIPEASWKAVKLGTPLLAPDISVGRGLLIEAILTFLLVWVIFATAVDENGVFVGKIAGLAIGFVIVMDILVGGPFTGAAMNPARAFGPALIGGNWDQHLVYWVGPIAGGAIAALSYELVVLRPRRNAT